MFDKNLLTAANRDVKELIFVCVMVSFVFISCQQKLEVLIRLPHLWFLSYPMHVFAMIDDVFVVFSCVFVDVVVVLFFYEKKNPHNGEM